MRTLLIDNYDSYTYNLYQLLARVYEVEPVVRANDDPSLSQLDLSAFDAIVISPGPGQPACARDFGYSRAALEQEDIPVLGVCLGHQGLGLVAGGVVEPASEPRHGHLSTIRHTNRELFDGLPQGFVAVRYHSLCVAEPLPGSLEAIAWSEDGVVMGLRHRTLPQWGVQFHPESVCTEYGAELLRNFKRLCLAHAAAREAGPAVCPSALQPVFAGSTSELRVHHVRLDQSIDPEQAYLRLYGQQRRSFWLDSARHERGMSRFSFMGAPEGSTSEVLSYRVGDDAVSVEPAGGRTRYEHGSIFQALERRARREVIGADALPFEFVGGYVGYFGYELKAQLGANAAHRAETPDAIWMRADRFIAFDHDEHKTYVVAVADPKGAKEAQAWVDRTSSLLSKLRTQSGIIELPEPIMFDPEPWASRSREQYLADIRTCQRYLRQGESYEICLTNKFRMPAPADDLEYYRRLRRINPAPYSALFRSNDLSIFCSSPERYLSTGRQRVVESKPIKGTAPRGENSAVDEALREALRNDPKTRAENLMIVDLLRNDLGRVCEVGSVHVPHFMATESYTTVHQLVSTIRGTLREGVSAVECAATCFPGGSMTGAPKLRTMEIIDALEREARGVYSGSIGYFAFGGAADLNIVIRTAVRCGSQLSVGAGGAIVLDSDPVAEYEEMLLKACAPLRALPPQMCRDLQVVA